MASRHKVSTLGMEDVVREGLADGLTHDAIVEQVNMELVVRHDKKKGKPPSISVAALERYLAALPAGAVAALHSQGTAQANAALALNFGARFNARMEKLDVWLEDVDTAERTMEVDGKTVNLGPDWPARKAMMSEERRWLQLYVDLMERIFNAEQVRLFQQAVMEAIRDVEPEVAQRIEKALQDATRHRAAALLGQA